MRYACSFRRFIPVSGRGALRRSPGSAVGADFEGPGYFGCLKGVSKSLQVLFNGMEAVVVPTLRILKQPALFWGSSCGSDPPDLDFVHSVRLLNHSKSC